MKPPVPEARKSFNKVPVILQTKDTVKKVPGTSDKIDVKNDVALNTMETPPIIKVQPPIQRKFNPLNKKIHLMVCASDQVAAANKLEKEVRKTLLGTHPRNKYHFRFSTFHDENTTNKIKSNLNYFNEAFGIIDVISENKHYLSDPQFLYKIGKVTTKNKTKTNRNF